MRLYVLGWMIVLAAVLPGCTGAIIYERGLPKRVEVKKKASKPKVSLSISQPRATVDVVVTEKRRVRLERRIVYSTVETRGEYSNPAWELLEIPAWGVAIVPILVALPFMDPPEGPLSKADPVRFRLLMVFGLINPAQSVFAPDAVRDPTSDEEMFFSEPKITIYEVATPKKGVEVTYAVEDAHGNELQRTKKKSDVFGRVAIEVPPGGHTVRAWVGRERVSLRIKRRAPAPSAASSPEALEKPADEASEPPTEQP